MGTELVDAMGSVRAYLAAEKSDNTKRAYRVDWEDFIAWCSSAELDPLPASPATVARYLAHLADKGLKAATIERRAAAIRYAHRVAGLEPPTNAEAVKAVTRGIRRMIGTAQVQKAPATAAAIASMIEGLSDASIIGLRDKALLLLAFAAALRRSELVDLKVNDVERVERGIILHIRRSKTDQEAKGEEIAVPHGHQLQPVAALDAWLAAAHIEAGPIFRAVDRHSNVGKRALSDRSVARVIKRAARAAGLDEEIFSGHSPRAGFVTTALEHGADLLKIMHVTRHTDVRTLKKYDRRSKQAFDAAAGKDFL